MDTERTTICAHCGKRYTLNNEADDHGCYLNESLKEELSDFRRKQHEYFNPYGEKWDMDIENEYLVMEQMLRIIDGLEHELNLLT